MSKPTKRICPACGQKKEFRADQITCGCRGSNPNLSVPASAEGIHLHAKISELEKQIKGLLKERGKFESLVKGVFKEVPPYPPYQTWIPPADKSNNSEVALVIKASDWQIGEVISARETEEFGSFNYATAQKRVFKLVEKVVQQAEMYRRGGFNLRQLHIFSEADLVSGNIHHELEVTNEWPVIIAVEKAAELFAEMVRRLATSFESIHLWEMSADNHGRLTHKNQAKQGALNNFSRISHTLANAFLKQLVDSGQVKIDLSEGTRLLADVLGKKFLISHGHEVMGSLGIPYYGLSRGKAREAVKRMNTPHTFDFISCGHWHVPGVIEGNILVNGSLTGTTEFDHMQGRHAPPQQVSFLVHPTHGIFGWTAWKL